MSWSCSRAKAAQTAKRSPQFAATYQAIAHRRGKNIATTATARKLLTRAYHLLTDTDTGAAADKTFAPLRRSAIQTGKSTPPRASSQNRMSRPRRAR